MAQHWGRRGTHLNENKGVKSECKKLGENSRQMVSVSTICDEYCRVMRVMRVIELSQRDSQSSQRGQRVH